MTAARVMVASKQVEPGSVLRRPLPETDRTDVLLAIIGDTVRSAARPGVRAWCVATPGPFDYERGIATIAGVAKLDALHGVDLRHELARVAGVVPEAVLFLNDADAFLLGEWWAGRARGHDRAMGITIGTGLGSAFMIGGAARQDGPGVPPEARLDLLPFRGAPVEETLSRRGLLAAYRRAGGAASDVRVIAERAQGGERTARDMFDSFGSSLGEFLRPVIDGFEPSSVVFGGGIARSWTLFADAFVAACAAAIRGRSVAVAEHLEEAPLLGAALHATRR